MGTKYRAQILLEPEQHDALAEAALRENRSISNLVREIVNEWIQEQEPESIWRKREAALNSLRTIREEIENTHGVYQGDIIEEVRSGRDEDRENIWQNSQ